MTQELVHDGSRDFLDRHGRKATLDRIRRLMEIDTQQSDEIDRLRKVVNAALVWAGDKVMGDPEADRRLAAVLVEYEGGTREPTEAIDTNGHRIWYGPGDK